jgi:hypothetical protein
MAGRFGAEFDENIPIADYISWVGDNPGILGPEARSVVRTIDLSGDAGHGGAKSVVPKAWDGQPLGFGHGRSQLLPGPPPESRRR